MAEGTTVMTRKGQITVPAEIRRALGLRVGDRVEIRLDEATGQASLRPVGSVARRTYGAANRGGPPLDLDEMRRRFEQEGFRASLLRPDSDE